METCVKEQKKTVLVIEMTPQSFRLQNMRDRFAQEKHLPAPATLPKKRTVNNISILQIIQQSTKLSR